MNGSLHKAIYIHTYGFYILYTVIVTVLALFPFHLQCDEGTACLYDARFSPDGTHHTEQYTVTRRGVEST